MLKRFCLIFLVLIWAGEAFGQKGFVQPLFKVAEVTMPDTPKVDTSYDQYSTAAYYAQTYHTSYLARLTRFHSSTNDFFTKDLRDSVYANMMSVAKDSGSRLFYKKAIVEYGMHGMFFAFTKHYDDSLVSYHYYRCFYFNHSLLSMSVWSLDSLSVGDKKITDYFNTLKFKISAAEMQQENFADKAFTWRTLLIAIFIFLSIIVAVALLGKLAYKK